METGTPQPRPRGQPADTISSRDLLLGTALAFVAGFVDAAGFVALAGLFTSHVTGNFVVIGAELFTSASGILAKLLALPAFAASVVATRLIALALERRDVPPLRPLLLMQALLLALFLAAGIVASPIVSPDSAAAILAGMLGVAAMGVQNAIARLSLAHLAATTVMTVNVTQIVIDAVDVCRAGGARGPTRAGSPARKRLHRMVPPVLAFASGAIAGAFGIVAWSFAAIALPIAILIVLVATIGAPEGD